jgi:hypothetical protein
MMLVAEQGHGGGGVRFRMKVAHPAVVRWVSGNLNAGQPNLIVEEDRDRSKLAQ